MNKKCSTNHKVANVLISNDGKWVAYGRTTGLESFCKNASNTKTNTGNIISINVWNLCRICSNRFFHSKRLSFDQIPVWWGVAGGAIFNYVVYFSIVLVFESIMSRSCYKRDWKKDLCVRRVIINSLIFSINVFSKSESNHFRIWVSIDASFLSLSLL